MSLLSTSSIQLFSNLEEINDGFRIPDKAYIYGNDFSCFEVCGSDCYFSNYWYGEKQEAEKFAEDLAEYFKNFYDANPIDPQDGDFQGLVMLWYVNDKALVGTINLNREFSLLSNNYEVPQELKASINGTSLVLLLCEGSDNEVIGLLYTDIPEEDKKALFSCVAENFKQYYLEVAKDNGITL